MRMAARDATETLPSTRAASVAAQAHAPTLAALGIVAYVAETMLHEAAGHGGACLATGGRIDLLAPLFMRCSVVSPVMVAAGPALNLLAGLLAWLALRRRDGAFGSTGYFLWLTLAFNWLVAAGYLFVGAATGFGDWGVLFQGVAPAWLWRVPAGIGAVLLYLFFRAQVAREFLRLTGLVRPGAATFVRTIGVPTGAAAIVALAAQAYGQGSDPLGLALALGCTAVVGLSLWGIEAAPTGPASIDQSRLHVGRSVPWLVVAAGVAIAFIVWIGPGATT
jgi:hypothetical protein